MSSSSSTPNPWSPYETYKDCSQGICSMYCPQWCYFIFPPPPPFTIDDDDDSSAKISPLIIALIGILASAFILVSYYTIFLKYCRRRRQQINNSTSLEFNENRDETNHDGWQNGSSQGLDESLIKTITVCKYKKNESLIDGTDCSVCLSEFMEDESLRLLPKCNHAFHVPCIDTWLKSHSSCPLCRANIASTTTTTTTNNQPASSAAPTATAVVSVSAIVYQRRNEAISVVQDLESGVRDEAVVSIVVNEDVRKTDVSEIRQDGDRNGPLRWSVSQGQVTMSIADILHVSEEEDELQVEQHL